MKATALARWAGSASPVLTKFPPGWAVKAFSRGRKYFLEQLKYDIPSETYTPPEDLERTLWGIKFRSPIGNAAGMFKNGECYEMIAKQGAGFYLGGTGTWDARLGNTRGGIHLPFAIYPRSHAASNSLGLPNDGDKENAGRAVYLERTPGCPVGWSVMGSSSLKDEEKLPCLVDGMRLYDAAGVDFLELNESCPNTDHGKPQDNGLVDRLHYIAQHFLSHRRHTRRMPVVVKFSNDTHPQQVPALVELLINFGFDGVNFGNTSTAYPRYHQIIDPAEQKLFDYYTTTFGGGISGRPLRDISLALSAAAVKAVQEKKPKQDFHVIRTGGVETWEDVQASLDAGVALVGWFTGYFHGFGKHGHDVYKNLYAQR